MCGCVGVSLCINENMDPRGYLYSTSQLNLTFFAVHEFQKEQLSSLITSLSLSAFFFFPGDTLSNVVNLYHLVSLQT